MASKKHLQLIERTNKTLQELEDAAIKRIEAALEAAYQNLERQLLAKYPSYTAEAKPGLLANQRALLLMDEIKALLPLLNPALGKQIQKEFKKLLKVASEEGITLSGELMRLTAGDEFVKSTATVPIEAVAIAAEQSYKRLEKHGADFAGKSTALITQGLIQGWGAQRVVPGLRQQLGITKGRAQMIARTETMAAHNQAAQQNFQANNIEYFQWIATGDDRLCPMCGARNGNVYELGKAPIPGHPQCRCYAMPYMKEWAALGLTNDKWMEDFRAQGLKELEATGKKPDPGLMSFEKAMGLEQPPKPVWSPGQAPSYQRLIERGRQRAASLGKDLELAQIEVFREKLLTAGLSEAEAQRLTEMAALSSDAEAIAPMEYYEKILNEFHQITGGVLKTGDKPGEFQGLFYSGGRAFADLDGWINVGDTPHQPALFHELGHVLEYQHPELAKAARDWRDARATGAQQPLWKMSDLNYDDAEKAVPDHFVDPYVGKVYDGGWTEVISLGMEHFGSSESMKHLLERDPEHFYFILGAIEEAQQARKAGRQQSAESRPDQRLYSGLQDIFSGGYRPLTPVEEAMARAQKNRAEEFAAYLKREEESIRRRTSGEIDRQLREYYDAEAAELRRRLGIPSPVQQAESEGKALKLKPATLNLKPLSTSKDLDAVTPANETQRKAVAIARDYEALVNEVNEVLSKIPGAGRTLPPDAYQRIYGKVNQIMDRLKGAVNEAKTLSGKTGDKTLERYMSTIAKASKEALPGYEIRAVNADIAKYAEKRPC